MKGYRVYCYSVMMKDYRRYCYSVMMKDYRITTIVL